MGGSVPARFLQTLLCVGVVFALAAPHYSVVAGPGDRVVPLRPRLPLEYSPRFVSCPESLEVKETEQLLCPVIATSDRPGPILLTADSLPDNATFVDNGDGWGMLQFRPDRHQLGVYRIMMIVADGVAADTALIPVTVLPLNAPPVWDPVGPVDMDEDSILDLTVRASDPDGTVPVLTADTLPVNADFMDMGDGTGRITFSPALGQLGRFVLTLIASDSELSDTLDVVITVWQVHFPPDTLAGVEHAFVLGKIAAFSASGQIDQLRLEDVDLDGLADVLYRETPASGPSRLRIWSPAKAQEIPVAPLSVSIKAFSLRSGDNRLEPVLWCEDDVVRVPNGSGTDWDSVAVMPEDADYFHWLPDNPRAWLFCGLAGERYNYRATDPVGCEIHYSGASTDLILVPSSGDPVTWANVGCATSNPAPPSGGYQCFVNGSLSVLFMRSYRYHLAFDGWGNCGNPNAYHEYRHHLVAIADGNEILDTVVTHWSGYYDLLWWYDAPEPRFSDFAIGFGSCHTAAETSDALVFIDNLWPYAPDGCYVTNGAPHTRWRMRVIQYDGVWQVSEIQFDNRLRLNRGGIVTCSPDFAEVMAVDDGGGDAFVLSIPDAEQLGFVGLPEAGAFLTGYLLDQGHRDVICWDDSEVRIYRMRRKIPVRDPMTLNVPNDYAAIQTAINAAVSGDTVLVGPGTYTENLDFYGKSIKLFSSRGADSTLLFPATGDPLIRIDTGEDSTTELAGFTLVAEGAQTAIDIANGANPTIHHNVIRDCGAKHAIWCQSAGITISRNLFLRCAHNCIGVFTGGVSIVNNTFDHNAYAVRSLADPTVFRNNIVSNTSSIGIYYYFSVIDYNNFWCNNSNYGYGARPGEHDISFDPMFNDPDSGDYTLQIGSLCVDNGDPAPEYRDPDGTVADIGAFPLDPSHVPRPVHLNLRPERRERVVSHNPTFYWSYLDKGATSQQRFEIEVGSDDDWSIAEMWDSGEIVSSETTAVYDGVPLMDGHEYRYRVRVHNGSRWGDWPASFFMMNSLPSAPVIVFPGDQTTLNADAVSLIVENAEDADSDSLIYEFVIYEDSGLTQVAASESGVAEQPETTRSGVFGLLMESRRYWWRARAFDGFEYSPWSAVASFYTQSAGVIRVPEDQPSIQAGVNAAGNGDTVLVSPGTYVENVNFSGKQIIVTSLTGPESTVIRGADSTTAVVSLTSAEPKGAELSGFTVTGGWQSGIHALGSSPTIRNCIIVGNSAYKYPIEGGGIDLRNTTGALVKGNVIHDNQGRTYGAAIHMQSCRDDTICYNTMYSNLGVGDIRCLSTDASVFNNTISVTTCSGIASQAGSNLEVFNNIIFFAPVEAIVAANGSISARYNCAFANGRDYRGTSPGPGSVSESAQFVDTATHDYRLQEGSPCIDAGDPDSLYNDPDGSRNDIGAIPYEGSAPRSQRSAEPTDLLRVVYLIDSLHSTASRTGEEMAGATNARILKLITSLFQQE